MRPLGLALVAVLLLSSFGCARESIARKVDYTHWHDDETIIFVYQRSPSPGGLNAIFRPLPTTTHVMVCKVEEDNAVRCRDQRQLTNLLNPHAVDSVDLADR